jgi:hypothetical protein
MKRRLSSSSVENDSEDEEDYGDQAKVDVEKIKRNVQALDKLDKESSIAHILKQNIAESQNKQRLPLHWVSLYLIYSANFIKSLEHNLAQKSKTAQRCVSQI